VAVTITDASLRRHVGGGVNKQHYRMVDFSSYQRRYSAVIERLGVVIKPFLANIGHDVNMPDGERRYIMLPRYGWLAAVGF